MKSDPTHSDRHTKKAIRLLHLQKLAAIMTPERRYGGFQVFFNLLLWIPVFYAVQKQLGLNDPEIFRIQSIYYIIFCFLEIPTGIIADRFGYRFSIALGGITLVVANLLPIATPSYGGFLWHFLLIALARSLVSGAASAYLYEYLKTRGEAGRYKKVEGDARFWSLVARVVAWICVGWLLEVEVLLPYWISAANAAIALLFALTLPRLALMADASSALTASAGKFGKLAAAVKTIGRSPLLFLLMAQGVGIFVMVRILQVNLYQPILTAKSFDVTAFGWMMSLMTVFEAFGSKLAHRTRSYMSDYMTVTSATLVLAGCLGLIAASGQAGTILGFCIFSLATGIAFPVQKQVLNDAVTDTRYRATVLSMESILDRALCSLAVLPLGGLVADSLLTPTLYIAGLIAGVMALLIQVGIRVFEKASPASTQKPERARAG